MAERRREVAAGVIQRWFRQFKRVEEAPGSQSHPVVDGNQFDRLDEVSGAQSDLVDHLDTDQQVVVSGQSNQANHHDTNQQAMVSEDSVKEMLESRRKKLMRQWTESNHGSNSTSSLASNDDKQRLRDEKARLARLEAIEVLKCILCTEMLADFCELRLLNF